MERKLYRSRNDQVIGGVCSGIAEYFGVDTVIVRLLAALAVFIGGGGVMAYIIMWIVIPEKPSDMETSERTFEDKEFKKRDSNKIIGLGLIALGGYLGIQRFIPWDLGQYIWPAILIIGGLYILTRRKDEA